MNLSGLCHLVMSGDHDKFFVYNQSSQTAYEEFSAKKICPWNENTRVGGLASFKTLFNIFKFYVVFVSLQYGKERSGAIQVFRGVT